MQREGTESTWQKALKIRILLNSQCVHQLSANISHTASAMDTVEEISSKCSRRAKLIHEIFQCLEKGSAKVDQAVSFFYLTLDMSAKGCIQFLGDLLWQLRHQVNFHRQNKPVFRPHVCSRGDCITFYMSERLLPFIYILWQVAFSRCVLLDTGFQDMTKAHFCYPTDQK